MKQLELFDRKEGQLALLDLMREEIEKGEVLSIHGVLIKADGESTHFGTNNTDPHVAAGALFKAATLLVL